MSAVFSTTAIVVGTAYSIHQSEQAAAQQRKAYKEQKRASALQQKQADIAAARERISILREAKIKRAQTLASAAFYGAQGSSSLLGGLGSLQSQAATQLGASAQTGQMSSLIGSHLTASMGYQSQANIFQTQAQIGQSVAGLGSTIFSAGMHFSKPASTTG